MNDNTDFVPVGFLDLDQGYKNIILNELYHEHGYSEITIELLDLLWRKHNEKRLTRLIGIDLSVEVNND